MGEDAGKAAGDAARNVRPRTRRTTPRPASRLLHGGAAALFVIALLAVVWMADAERHRSWLDLESPLYPAGRAAFDRGDDSTAIALLTASIDARPRAPRAYRDLVDASVRGGDAVETETWLRELVARDGGNPAPHYALGKLALLRHDLPAARMEAEEAIARDAEHAYARLLLGLVHYRSGRPEPALAEWKRARARLVRERDLLGEALALNNLAMLDLDQHRYARAQERFERTLAIHERLENVAGQTLALMNIGLAQVDRGAFVPAAGTLRRALGLARERNDRAAEGRILEYLCDAIEKTGDYERALNYADTLLALARPAGDRRMEGAAHQHLATAWADLGDLQPALASGKRALALAESLGTPRDHSAALLTLADVEIFLGRHEDARRHLLCCDSVATAGRIEANVAMAQMGLCLVARAAGDSLEAAARGRRALERCEALGYAEGEGQAASVLAGLALGRGDLSAALALADRAVRISRAVGRRIDEARARARRSAILLAMGDMERSRSEARDALQLAHATGSGEALALASLALGDALRGRDDAEALASYETGMQAVEALQGRLRLDELKAGYLESRLELYRRAVELLVEMGRTEGAFGISERYRARALRDLLAARADGRDLRSAADHHPRTAAGHPPESAAPGGFLSGAPDGELDRIRRALPMGSILLEYLVTPRRSFCFVVDAEKIEVVELTVTDADLAREVAALCRPFAKPRGLDTIAFDAARAARLRRRLLDPALAGRSEVRHLYVVPDGALAHLPFELLPWDDATVDSPTGSAASPAASSTASPASASGSSSVPSAGGDDDPAAPMVYAPCRDLRFVDDMLVVSYLPSAACLAWARGRRAEPAATDGAFGARVGWKEPAGELLVLAPPSGLRHAMDEAAAISAVFPGARILREEAATESALRVLAPRHRRLHVSTHGLVDPVSPWHSGLMLAPRGADDGCLHAAEVLELGLDCELVVLSACGTGLGRLYAGEGWLGLSRAFLCAGVDQIVVSLWPVHDGATAILMKSVYRELASGAEPAKALGAARRELRRRHATTASGLRVSYAQPFFWAPFVLIGAPRAGAGTTDGGQPVPATTARGSARAAPAPGPSAESAPG